MKEALCDLRYLLNRGYRRKTALDFVSNHYKLSLKERNFLVRSVFSREEAEGHRKKLVDMKAVSGQDLTVDGYNVLITVETILKGEEVVLCDDGFIRDTSATFGRHAISENTRKAIEEVGQVIKKSKAKSAALVFDSGVSRSGELCTLVEKRLNEAGVKTEARISPNADLEVSRGRGIICTSDRAIIKKVERVFDIPFYIAEEKGKIKELLPCTFP